MNGDLLEVLRRIANPPAPLDEKNERNEQTEPQCGGVPPSILISSFNSCISSPKSISIDDPDWRDLFVERAAVRQHDGGYNRAEALAWGEVENRWHMLHGERVPTDICAGCRKPIAPSPALDLIDGNRVNLADDHACLRQHGWRWRKAATDGLIKLGLEKPAHRNRRQEADLPVINLIVGRTDAELTQNGSEQYREHREQRNGPEHRQ